MRMDRDGSWYSRGRLNLSMNEWMRGKSLRKLSSSCRRTMVDTQVTRAQGIKLAHAPLAKGTSYQTHLLWGKLMAKITLRGTLLVTQRALSASTEKIMRFCSRRAAERCKKLRSQTMSTLTLHDSNTSPSIPTSKSSSSTVSTTTLCFPTKTPPNMKSHKSSLITSSIISSSRLWTRERRVCYRGLMLISLASLKKKVAKVVE